MVLNFGPKSPEIATADALRFIHLKNHYKTTGLNFQEWHDHSIQSVITEWKEANTNQRPSGLELVYEDPSPFPPVQFAHFKA